MLAVSVVALAFVAAQFGAGAVSPSAEDGRALAVSLPPDAIQALPGALLSVPVRVSNAGRRPVTVTFSPGRLQLGDEGQADVVAGPDPLWANQVTLPAGERSIPANGFKEFTVRVKVPPSIAPDLYFVAFLTTPVSAPGANLEVINQIGSYFGLDVPGERVIELDPQLEIPGTQVWSLHLPFVIGSEATGTLHVTNIGPSQARFFGETDTTSAPGGDTPSQARIENTLLPTGRTRSFPVTGAPAWPIGVVTFATTISHATPDQASIAVQQTTAQMLVISPWVIVVILMIIAAGVLYYWRRARQRRLRREQSYART